MSTGATQAPCSPFYFWTLHAANIVHLTPRLCLDLHHVGEKYSIKLFHRRVTLGLQVLSVDVLSTFASAFRRLCIS